MITVYTMEVGKLEDPKIFEAAMGKIDRVRYLQISRIANQADKIRSLGAGLLLQCCTQETHAATKQEDTAVNVEKVQLMDILTSSRSPRQLSYVYGTEGKPYFADIPDLFFSLSHSGSFAICAVSDREVGADIQMKKAQSGLQLAERFFHKKEQQLLGLCTSDSETREVFYRLWAAKEAYMKLSGMGIKQGLDSFYADFDKGQIVDCTQSGKDSNIGLWEQEWNGEYRLAVCYYKNNFYNSFTEKW